MTIAFVALRDQFHFAFSIRGTSIYQEVSTIIAIKYERQFLLLIIESYRMMLRKAISAFNFGSNIQFGIFILLKSADQANAIFMQCYRWSVQIGRVLRAMCTGPIFKIVRQLIL